MQEFSRARKSVSEAQVARDKIVGGRRTHSKSREAQQENYLFPSIFRLLCEKRVSTTQRRMPRVPRSGTESGARHLVQWSSAGDAAESECSVELKSDPRQLQKGLVLPAERDAPAFPLSRSLALAKLFLSRCCCDSNSPPQFISLTPLTLPVYFICLFATAPFGSRSPHSARRLFKKSQHPTHKHTHTVWQTPGAVCALDGCCAASALALD